MPSVLDPPDLRIWDRQRDESPASWFAFKLWRDRKPRPTYAALAEELDVEPTTVGRWASEWGWKARGLEYDRWLDSSAQEAARATEALTVEKMRTAHLEAGLEARRLAVEAIKVTLADLKSGERPVTPQAAARLLDVATRLERLTLGQATEISEGADYSRLTDEEFDALRRLQSKADGVS